MHKENISKKVFVVDDEPLARQRLSKMISKLDRYDVVGEAGEAVAALGLIEQYQPDVVLLDISMPGMNGIELAHRFAQMNASPAIIFCTAHDEYALEAFNTLAVGYLMKPVREEHLLESLNKAEQLNQLQLKALQRVDDTSDDSANQKQHLIVNSHRGVEMLEIANIYYFSSEDKYVFAHHDKGQTILEQSLKALEDELSQSFIRVHRNALISIAHIQSLERRNSETCVRLKGTDSQPSVSRRHLKKLKDLIALL